MPAEMIFYGKLPFVLSKRRARNGLGELDTLTIDVLIDTSGTALEDEGYVEGQLLPDYDAMWVDKLAEDEEAEGISKLTVQAVGLLKEGEKRKRTISVAGQVISIGPIEKKVVIFVEGEKVLDPETGEEVEGEKVMRLAAKVDSLGETEYKSISTPSGSADRWQINTAFVTVQDRYFTTTPPSTVQSGTVSTPPAAPEVPEDPWTGYTDPKRARHPYGWVLDSREIEELFNNGESGLWLVTDNYGYYFASTPD